MPRTDVGLSFRAALSACAVIWLTHAYLCAHFVAASLPAAPAHEAQQTHQDEAVEASPISLIVWRSLTESFGDFLANFRPCADAKTLRSLSFLLPLQVQSEDSPGLGGVWHSCSHLEWATHCFVRLLSLPLSQTCPPSTQEWVTQVCDDLLSKVVCLEPSTGAGLVDGDQTQLQVANMQHTDRCLVSAARFVFGPFLGGSNSGISEVRRAHMR